jgi:Flp pilus assembly protein TadG
MWRRRWIFHALSFAFQLLARHARALCFVLQQGFVFGRPLDQKRHRLAPQVLARRIVRASLASDINQFMITVCHRRASRATRWFSSLKQGTMWYEEQGSAKGPIRRSGENFARGLWLFLKRIIMKRARQTQQKAGGVWVRRRRRISSRRRAQSIVEFALVVPALLAVLIGILEFGWLTKNTMTLSSAAREAARAAAVGKSTANVNNIITHFSSPIRLTGADGNILLQQCDSSGSTCTAWPGDDTTVTPVRNGVKPPNMVRVTLTSYHQSLTGFIPGLNRRPIVAAVTIRREA